MDLGTQRSQNIKRQPRLSTKLVLRRRFVCHPRRYARDRAVGLGNNDQLSTTVGILPGNEHGLAAPGMKRVVNPPLDRVSAGSMSLLRIKPGLSEYRSSAPGDAWRSSAAAYERRPAWRCRHARLPGERSDAAGAHSYAARGSRETTRADRETSNPSCAQRATIHAISQEGWARE